MKPHSLLCSSFKRFAAATSKNSAFHHVGSGKPLSSPVVTVTAVNSVCTMSAKPNEKNRSPSSSAGRPLSAPRGGKFHKVKSPDTPVPARVPHTGASFCRSTDCPGSSLQIPSGLTAMTKLPNKPQQSTVHRGYGARFHSEIAAVKVKVRYLMSMHGQSSIQWEDPRSIGGISYCAKNPNAGSQASTGGQLSQRVSCESSLPDSGMRQRGMSGKTIMNFYDGHKSLGETRRNYVFSHGATGFPKDAKKALPPEEDKLYSSKGVGEDAYFARHDSMGVADGVGGWCGTPGANPALFSRKLMHYAHQELEKYDCIDNDEFYDYYKIDPVQVMRRGFDMTSTDAESQGIVGSTTACIAILRDDELRIANLGDCGVSVIRQNDFIFRTEEQQHSFNFPYQLGTGSKDTPEDAHYFKVKIQKGDIVIVGTDGIYDNLFDEDILEEVMSCMVPPVTSKQISSSAGNSTPNTEKGNASPTQSPINVATPTGVNKNTAALNGGSGTSAPVRPVVSGKSYPTINPQRVSDAIARRARSVAEDSRNVNSPFQSRAMQEGLYYQGGKMDDISVIVCQIVDCEDSPDRR